MKEKGMCWSGKRALQFLTMLGLVVGCASLLRSAQLLPAYSKVLTLGPGIEWRFHPLVVDFNRDGHPDLVATARLVKPALHMWLGDGKGSFTPAPPTWTDIGYAALATGDINGDGFPDIVAASHLGDAQKLLNHRNRRRSHWPWVTLTRMAIRILWSTGTSAGRIRRTARTSTWVMATGDGKPRQLG